MTGTCTLRHQPFPPGQIPRLRLPWTVVCLFVCKDTDLLPLTLCLGMSISIYLFHSLDPITYTTDCKHRARVSTQFFEAHTVFEDRKYICHPLGTLCGQDRTTHPSFEFTPCMLYITCTCLIHVTSTSRILVVSF